MQSDGTHQSRRSVLKKSGMAVSALAGAGLLTTRVEAGYDHRIRVETDGSGGAFRCWMPAPSARATENVEASDLWDQNGKRLESYVSTGWLAEGYDVFKWNDGASSPDDLTINEYNHGIDAYFDGELIDRPDWCGGGC
nr:twin-arginine translocation signal domain-containing protein [Haloarchaeobius sp. HME9146]